MNAYLQDSSATCELCPQPCVYPLQFHDRVIRRYCMDHMRALEPECAEIVELLLVRIALNQTTNKQAAIPQMDDAGG
jgi:hypothetical protein